MQTYHVQYEIDVDADSPEAAALLVESYMKAADSYRPVLDVTDENGETTRIDLEELEVSEEETDSDDPDNTETRVKANQPSTLKTYTVVLLYPDGDSSYTETTQAETAGEAARIVQKMAADANNGDYDQDDFQLAAMFEGNLTPVMSL